MTNESIASETQDSSKKEEDSITLYPGQKAPHDFYHSIRLIVAEKLPELNRGRSYTLKEIFPKEVWQQFGAGDCSLAGKYLAHMADKKLLPLVFTGLSGKFSKRYQLK